jgi:hypothetical protein
MPYSLVKSPCRALRPNHAGGGTIATVISTARKSQFKLAQL